MQLTWVHLQNILTARTTQYQTNKQPCQIRGGIPEKILQRRNTVDQYARRTLIITQFSSVAQLCPTLFTSWTACSTPGFLVHYQHSELAQTHVHRVSEAIQSSHLLLSHSPPTFNFPSIRVLSNESVLRIRGSEYWNFSFSISLSNVYAGLISFRINCLDLLAVQGILKSLLQHHISKASVLWHSAFFTDQLLHPYMTTGKTKALTIQTFVGKLISLLFNM